MEQGCPLAFGEASLASTAGEHACLLATAIAEANAQIVVAALAVVLALGILAAEGFQVVHDAVPLARARKKLATDSELLYKVPAGTATLL